MLAGAPITFGNAIIPALQCVAGAPLLLHPYHRRDCNSVRHSNHEILLGAQNSIVTGMCSDGYISCSMLRYMLVITVSAELEALNDPSLVHALYSSTILCK